MDITLINNEWRLGVNELAKKFGLRTRSFRDHIKRNKKAYESFGNLEVKPIQDSFVIFYLNRDQIFLLLTSIRKQYQIKADIINELNYKMPPIVVGMDKEIQFAEQVKDLYKKIFHEGIDENKWTIPDFQFPIYNPQPPYVVGDPLPGRDPTTIEITTGGTTEDSLVVDMSEEDSDKRYKWVPNGEPNKKEETQYRSESDKVPSAFKDRAKRIISQ